MSRATPWFKMDARAWLDGTRGLDPAVRGCFVDVLALIYEHDGPVPDDAAWIAHQLHVSPRKWRAVRATLIDAGKLVVTPCGLTNRRAEIELENRANRRRVNAENGAKNTRAARENSETDNENNKSENQIGEPKPLYVRACQNQNLDSYSYKNAPESLDAARDGVVVFNGGAGRTPFIPPGWRSADLAWLQLAMPGRALGGERGLVRWLFDLERDVGANTVTETIARVRDYVESGEPKNVRAYITAAIKNAAKLANGAGVRAS